MKCVILCGGRGTRLNSETEFKPKPLIEIGGYPILWHIMKIYDNYGIKDFILPLGYKGDMIKRYFMEYSWRNENYTYNLKSNSISYFDRELNNSDNNILQDWNITFVDTGLESGTALRLYKVQKLLKSEPDFCLTYGDGVANVNLSKLIDFHKLHGKKVTITGLHPRSKYGLMIADKNQVVHKFTEKPILQDTINGGFMVMKNSIFEDLREDDNMLVDSTLPRLSKLGEIIMYKFQGFWHCMDTQKDWDSLNEYWKNGAPWKIWS
jgi:glucose-1-phosphate cytidylyltransferase